MSVNEIWKQILVSLENRVSRPVYEMLIKKIEPVEIDGDTFKVIVRGSMASEINNYSGIIKEELFNVMGREMGLESEIDESDVEIPIRTLPPVKRKTVVQETTRHEQRPPLRQESRISRPSLNSMYTFDTFVVGSNNQFCHNASRAVAEKPGQTYNPLFIYGGVGLGKTHLMHAIGQYVMSVRPDLNVAYVHADGFIHDYTEHILQNNVVGFRNYYLRSDLLLIDDIHKLEGKEGTQNEFFQLFNTFYENHKQIVITCDRIPRELTTLEERLVSRLGWGLIADIKPPDYETRFAILKRKLKSDNIDKRLHVPDEVLDYIAKTIKQNIRDLEGVLNIICARSEYNNQDITIGLAEDIISNIAPRMDEGEVTLDLIINAVAAHFGVDKEKITGKSRKKEIVVPRRVAMFMMREIKNLPYNSIGEYFGKDHTTVMYSCDTLIKEMEHDSRLQKAVEKIKEKITG